jgi:hypothetical protein
MALALTVVAFTAQPSQADGPNGNYHTYYGSGFQGPQYYGNGNYYKLGYGHAYQQAQAGSGNYQKQQQQHYYHQHAPTSQHSNYYCPDDDHYYYGQPYQPPQSYYQQPAQGYAYGY